MAPEMQGHNFVIQLLRLSVGCIMGKQDFDRIVESAYRARGEQFSIKISSFSHRYRSTGRFAGLIVYYKDGKFEWQQESCASTRNYRGKSFYVVIQDTAKWPDDREQRARGQGLVHDYILKHNIGINHDTEGHRVCCGGFAIIEGVVKYSSVWLNMTDGYCNGMSWKSDGSKYMSQLEQHFVNIAIREWRTYGPNRTVPLHKAHGQWQVGLPPASPARSIAFVEERRPSYTRSPSPPKRKKNSGCVIS